MPKGWNAWNDFLNKYDLEFSINCWMWVLILSHTKVFDLVYFCVMGGNRRPKTHGWESDDFVTRGKVSSTAVAPALVPFVPCVDTTDACTPSGLHHRRKLLSLEYCLSLLSTMWTALCSRKRHSFLAQASLQTPRNGLGRKQSRPYILSVRDQ